MMRALTREELALKWSEIQPYIDRAIEHGIEEQNSFDMFIKAMQGQYECWESVDDFGKTNAYGFARVNKFPKHSQLQIVAAAGEGFDEWGEETFDYAEDYARRIGCKYVTIWGRPGWLRKLRGRGYEKVYDVLAKEV